MSKFMSEIVAEIQFLIRRRPTKSYSPGSLATIALWKSMPMTRTCWLSRRRAVQHLAIARSQWLRQERGTDCLRLSELRRHLCLFARS